MATLSRLALPGSARLRQAAEFTRAFRSRHVTADRYFKVFVTDGPEPRLGMAVSRRVSTRAVERNRIRRRIRETFRLHRPDLPAADYVVVARHAAANCPAGPLCASLARHWTRAAELAASEDRNGPGPPARGESRDKARR